MKRNRRRPEVTGCWKARWKSILPSESRAASWLPSLTLALLGVLVVAGAVWLWNSPGAPADRETAPTAAAEPEEVSVDEEGSYVDYGTYDDE